MNKKWSRVALLLAPIAFVVVLLPVLRRTADVRVEKREEIRPTRVHIVSCELQTPTTWEAFQGAETTVVTHIVKPKDWMSQSTERDVIEVSNPAGQHWNNLKWEEWKEIGSGTDVSSGKSTEFADGTIVRNGLIWKKAVGQGREISVKVKHQNLDDADKVLHSAMRQFTLSDPPKTPALTSRRVANYTLKKVTLQTSKTGSGLNHLLSLSVNVPAMSLGSAPGASRDEPWNIRLKSDKEPEEMRIYSSESKPVDAKGIALIKMDFPDNSPQYRGKPASIGGLFSVEEGWPQDVQIKLPQGLPSKPGTIDLPFTAALAPLPK